MSNPNDNDVYPTYSGEVYFTVTLTCDDIEATDIDSLTSDLRRGLAAKLEGFPVSVIVEDHDLSISNEEEDFMSKADRLYEQQHDK